MASELRFWKRLGLEAAYFSGYALTMQRWTGGAGVILRFERVRPRRGGRFQPLKSQEITPQFLDRCIEALKRWKFDIVSIDEACQRSVRLVSSRRFVCLTFDGAYKDLMISAYPVLSRHRVPFAVYVPTAFPDGLGEAWWLALEQVIACENRLGLVMDRQERRFDTASASRKIEVYDFVSGWLRSLSPSDLSVAIQDICKRYSIDLAAITREASMDWSDLAKLGADPQVTIGTATMNYPVLSKLRDAAASREMIMGKTVAQVAFHRDITHFAYPFGDRGSWSRQHPAMVEEAGFSSAVSAISGVVETEGRTDRYALPRVNWDGRRRSLRILRVMLSGATFSRSKRKHDTRI